MGVSLFFGGGLDVETSLLLRVLEAVFFDCFFMGFWVVKIGPNRLLTFIHTFIL
jgi:hypothetical protein